MSFKKKEYTTPQLAEHGSVESITLNHLPNGNHTGPDPNNPSNGGGAPGQGSVIGNPPLNPNPNVP